MKLSRRLLKKLTFIGLSLVTALMLIVMESTSIAQVDRTPGGEVFPDPVTTPSPSPTPIRTPGGEIFPDPVSLGGTWLLPVPTANAQLAKPIVANPDVATVPFLAGSRSIPVLSNDFGEGLTIIEVSQSRDTTRINPDGTITITYRIFETRNRSFSYTIRDRYGRTATGTVFIEEEDPEAGEVGIP